jgi:hypothetical protein
VAVAGPAVAAGVGDGAAVAAAEASATGDGLADADDAPGPSRDHANTATPMANTTSPNAMARLARRTRGGGVGVADTGGRTSGG